MKNRTKFRKSRIVSRSSKATTEASRPTESRSINSARRSRTVFLGTLLPGQKNFIILLTDGWDTCECNSMVWDGEPAPVLRGDSLDRTPSLPVVLPPAGGCQQSLVRSYNSGLKGEDAFLRLNGGNATANLGDIWVVGMGLGTQPCATQTENLGLINHLAWEASGASLGNPRAHGALFASNRDELLDRLLDVLSNIAVPTTEVTLGSPIVGSVKELMQLTGATDANGVAFVRQDFLASGGADFEVINRRNQLRNNILFTTTVQLPDWRGHFRATNIFEVQADGTRTADLSAPVWDAGEKLQARDPDDRQIFFNRAVPVGTVPPAPIPFDTTNALPGDLGVAAGFLKELDPTGVGAATDADAAAIVIGIIRGKRLVISSTTGFYDMGALNLVEVDAFLENTWKLYDIHVGTSHRACPAPLGDDGSAHTVGSLSKFLQRPYQSADHCLPVVRMAGWCMLFVPTMGTSSTATFPTTCWPGFRTS